VDLEVGPFENKMLTAEHKAVINGLCIPVVHIFSKAIFGSCALSTSIIFPGTWPQLAIYSFCCCRDKVIIRSFTILISVHEQRWLWLKIGKSWVAFPVVNGLWWTPNYRYSRSFSLHVMPNFFTCKFLLNKISTLRDKDQQAAASVSHVPTIWISPPSISNISAIKSK